MVKTIITAAIAIVFVVTGLYAVFSASSLVTLGIEQALGVYDCTYEPRLPKDEEVECLPDTDRTKREVARGVATLLITLPVAWYSFRQLKSKTKA